MKITDIRIKPCNNDNGNKLKAFVSVTFDNVLVIHNIKVIENSKGLFLGMPSIKDTNGEYKDICHPLDTKFRNELTDAIIQKYEEITASGD